MKIMGLVTYAAHKWRDTVYLKLNKVCDHVHHCPCKESLLKKRALDRPFILEPIRKPMKIDGRFNEYSARDRETLIKVGLHISTILCADHSSTPAVPKNIPTQKNQTRHTRNAIQEEKMALKLRATE